MMKSQLKALEVSKLYLWIRWVYLRKNKRNKSAPKGIRDRKFINTGYSSGGASLTKQALRGYNPIQSSPQRFKYNIC